MNEMDGYRQLLEKAKKTSLTTNEQGNRQLVLTYTIDEQLVSLFKAVDFAGYGLIDDQHRWDLIALNSSDYGKEITVYWDEDPDHFEIFEKESELFLYFLNRNKIPEKGAIILEPYTLFFDADQINNNLAGVRQIKKLIDYITSIADYNNYNHCLFFKEQKLEINIDYNSLFVDNKLPIIPQRIDALIDSLQEQAHQEVRRNLFVGVLINHLIQEPLQDRLRLLIERLDTMFEAYKVSFNLYIEKFSYETIKKEITGDYIQFLKRLDDAVANLRTQVVVIATNAIALAQYSKDNLFKNIVIFITTLCASVLYFLIIQNNSETISEIHDEIENLEEDLKNKQITVLQERFVPYFVKLKSKVRKQRCKLFIFYTILFMSLISSFGMLIYTYTAK